MLKLSAPLLVLVICLAACAHRGAVRVECDGPLRPINGSSPAPSEAPVSVEPGNPDTRPSGEKAQ
jgi:hypothetical protein